MVLQSFIHGRYYALWSLILITSLNIPRLCLPLSHRLHSSFLVYETTVCSQQISLLLWNIHIITSVCGLCPFH
jgi:hypothetical protein